MSQEFFRFAISAIQVISYGKSGIFGQGGTMPPCPIDFRKSLCTNML